MTFDEIYSTYFQPVVRSASSYSHSPEDVAQMTFVLLLGKAGYENWTQSALGNYLFGTARKTALDKRVRDTYVPGGDGFFHEPNGLAQDEWEDDDARELGVTKRIPLDLYASETPSIAVQHEIGLELTPQMLTRLERLNGEEREVVLLVSEGLNTRMIGEVMGMSTDKAGSRFMQACAKMKDGEEMNNHDETEVKMDKKPLLPLNRR